MDVIASKTSDTANILPPNAITFPLTSQIGNINRFLYLSMYVPLFSAVVAKYQGGREDAPRLISLDEAFAGVDNRNIRDMFRLMTEFEFDFIINSQVLWGDCDTLDALAIYQLQRPQNAKFVTIMPYLWNGHAKEFLENEQMVEQRSEEIGSL